ncbi:MAG: hypothetical protein JWM31_2554, partial [Solirubrobacterales bacterium]|nr:hypothetical protein [Solirubrobacterales bacterium]
MSFLNNLWRDLVDKRLWPVAVALILLAVAVPILIGGGDDASDTAAVPPAPVESPVVQAQIAVAVDGDTPQRARPGRSRDPFKALVFAKVKAADATAGSGASASGTTSTAATTAPGPTANGGGSSPSSTTTPATTPSTTTPTAPTTTPTVPSTSTSTSTTTRLYDYALSLQTKRAGELTTRRRVLPVSYVPSAAYPLLSFVGVKSGTEIATFIVSSGVEVTGNDRVCRPSRARCQILELKAGDNVLLARTPPPGSQATHV